MKIDIFCHVFPESVLRRCFQAAPNLKDMGKRIQHIPMLYDLDLRFHVMDQFGDYCQVISLASPPLEAFGGSEVTPDLAQAANDAMADLVRRYPQRFPCFICCLPMNNPAAAEIELQRALRDLGDRKSTRLNSSHIPLSRMP